jgi:EAL domain-containing protein (putative c-di-GMP-specific phosphodiesterase class I)
LHKFRFDKLKIDQSFVRKLGDWREAELIVHAIVDLCNTLNVKPVAEGIETERQAAILRRMNCAVGQGFLFGHAAAASVANALVSEQYGARRQQSRELACPLLGVGGETLVAGDGAEAAG